MLLHARTIALVRKACFLLAGNSHSFQRTEDRHEVAINAQALPQFGERRVGLLTYQIEQASRRFSVQFRTSAAAMGFGFDRTGIAKALQKANDGGKVDVEEARQLSKRVFTRLDSRQDALPNINGIGSHTPPPWRCDPPIVKV